MVLHRRAAALLVGLSASAVYAAGGLPQPRVPAVEHGATLFAKECAACHDGAAGSRAPAPDVLRQRSPEAILAALTAGSMRPQGSHLSGAERRAVAEYLSGRALGGDVTGAAAGRCAATPPPRAVESGPAPATRGWPGWSPTIANTRFQPAAAAGLTAADVPALALRWAFGFPDATSAWSQPTVAGGRLFVGTHNGTVYSLDARTGCIAWTFGAASSVRTPIVVGPRAGGGFAVYFGDSRASAYALDGATGALQWTRRVDAHPYARITGAPALYGDRLYVPVSSYEEIVAADAAYPCCTFRGSLSALDTRTGATVWKTYFSPEPRRRAASTGGGGSTFGPSGAGIWAAPTIDVARRRVYAATGNTYSEPALPTSDAVIAFDLATGVIAWVRQVTPDDVFVNGCRPGSTNPNCPKTAGPDFDFGNAPMLAKLPGGRDAIVIGQKSGVAYAMDPDARGAIVWQYRVGQGSALGGLEWGSAVDGEHAYFPNSDILLPKPGGLHAVSLATGARVWYAPAPAPVCGAGRGCNAAQTAAITVIPGVVFSGSNDGALRAYATADGAIIWTFDTNRDFPTINGVPARGASMHGAGPTVADGMVYVNSGYGDHGGRPGNVLLAFGRPD